MDQIRVAELWLPSHNEVDVEVAKQFIASLPTPVSLEFFGAADRRSMLVRAPEETLNQITSKVSELWPRAFLNVLQDDPVRINPDHDSTGLNASFYLAEPSYLPLRIWDNYLRGDPIHGLLSSLLSLREQETLWVQVFLLEHGVPDWLAGMRTKLKAESQRGFVVLENGTSLTKASTVNHIPITEYLSPVRGFASLGVGLLLLIISILSVQGAWFAVLVGVLLMIASVGFLWRKLDQEEDPWRGADLSLVRQKVIDQDTFYRVVIRANVRADTPSRRNELLQRLEAQMNQYAIAGGNRLTLRRTFPEVHEESSTYLHDDEDSWIWLGSGELAGFWHPPVVNERIAPGLIPVRAIEVRMPDPRDVRGTYKIGSYSHSDGSLGPVQIGQASMERNILLVGKPGTGKTNLMSHLALAGMRDPEHSAIVVIDPHSDMAERLIGIIDPIDKERIVIMDVGDEEFALTINPLNPHRHGWDIESVSNSIVDIGQALWTDYWGPRMQNVLKKGVQLLVTANAGRMPEDMLGLSLLASLLNINHETRKRFIENELRDSPYYRQLSRWFYQYYKSLSPYTRETIIQSVLYKAHRFEEKPLLHLFSSPRSMLDLREVLEKRKVLIVNTRVSRHGPELSSFVGSLIINLLLREIAHQGESIAANRIPVMLIIDEFQTFIGVPWQELLAQTRKYGGRIVIGTQSLSSLRQNGDVHLPGIITSGVHSLFAFLMNGEDADYLTKYEFNRERGGPGAETLTNLEPFHAYARVVREDGGITAPFYFKTDPPPEFNAVLAEEVRTLRARYSIPLETAEGEAKDRLAYLDRYAKTHLSDGASSMQCPAQIRAVKGSTARSAMFETGDLFLDGEVNVRKIFRPPWNDSESEESPDPERKALQDDDFSVDDVLVDNTAMNDLEEFEALFNPDHEEEFYPNKDSDGEIE